MCIRDSLNAWSWVLLVSLLCGFAELGYGVMLGYPLLTAMQILVFNLCPVYVFLGVWIGARHPGIMRQFTRFSAYYAVVYTPIYFLFLSKLNLSLTGLVPVSYTHLPAMIAKFAGSAPNSPLAALLQSGSVTPAQAATVNPADVEALTNHAQSQDPSIIDRVSAIYAQHPTLCLLYTSPCKNCHFHKH